MTILYGYFFLMGLYGQLLVVPMIHSIYKAHSPITTPDAYVSATHDCTGFACHGLRLAFGAIIQHEPYLCQIGAGYGIETVLRPWQGRVIPLDQSRVSLVGAYCRLVLC